MGSLDLPKCEYFGPSANGDEAIGSPFPEGTAVDPFDFIPAAIELSAEERTLAAQYENGDFSGGYLRSQIAYFQSPLPKARHEERRSRLRKLQSIVAANNLKLPDCFVNLAETDDYIDRIRHNNIWLQIPEALVAFPHSPQHQLACIFYEGQGCGYWHLLLAPDHSHIVVYTDEPLGLQGDFVSGFKPDLTKYTFYQCAPSFDEWLANYFLDCIEGDKRYAEILEKYRDK